MDIKILIAVVILVGLGGGVYVIAGQQTKSVPDSVDPPAPVEIAMPDVEPEVIAARTLETLPPHDFVARTEGRTVLDVRTGEEYADGHLPGAQALDFYAPDFRAQLEALPRDSAYAIYCRSGNRSGQTLELMRELGFRDVVNLSGGIVAWQSDGREVCTSC